MNDCDHNDAAKVDVYKDGHLTWRTYRCVCGELIRTVEVPVNEADMVEIERIAAEWVQ